MRRLLPFAALLFLAPIAPAQIISVYGTFSPLHAAAVPSGLIYSLPPGSSPTQATADFWAPGVGGGVTLRLIPLGPVSLGLDLRGSTKPGTNGADTALGGLKLSVKPPFLGFKVYVQGSAGYLATRTVNQTHYAIDPIPVPQPFTNQFIAFEIIGGLDRHLAPFLDLRVIEVGAGRAYPVGVSFTNSTPTAGLFTLNSGLVFHF